ncbi:protein-glutamine gamma-glutamyltransferase 6-like [Porphyrio hochstetteri]
MAASDFFPCWLLLHVFSFTDLTPTHISWQPSVNAATNHTDRYANSELTVRRGQAFTITLYFNRPRQTGENLAFLTEIGPSPSESHRTKAVFNLSEELTSGWSAVQAPSESGSVNFTISSPANAVIGRYNLTLLVTSGNKIHSRFLGQFVLLFNPWCPGDEVYMANENERQEYVLNENGIIFVGNAKYMEARGWYYGQFQDQLLNICLTMLDLSLYYRQNAAIDVSRRGDPKYVGRVISSMINGNDNDNGVLLGKWQGSFHSHENPSRWDGSVVILQKWRQDNYKPVQYGQCWVFAGVMCTVLRCLGIPTRLVSNFNSAHDVDRNLSIDKYYDSSGKSLNIGKDSTWDYHVWNESWFIRPDLGASYNGWQVLDATPQEQSKGLFQCGPASVKAIKEGDVDLDYDTLFVYTEVNADCNRWIVYSDGTKKRVYCDTEIIGRYISTKAVGSNSRVDITCNYKYPEGSAEERQVYKKALAKILGSSITEGHTESSDGRPSEALRNPGISGKFKLAEPPVFGKDITLILILSNLSSDRKSVKVDMSASTVLYTRRTVAEILKANTSVDLGPKQGKHIRLKIPYSYYGKYLTTDKRIQVTALCEVLHTRGVKLLVEKTIILEDTNIIIKLPRRIVVNKAVTLEISYANPLPEPVSRCVLLVTLMNQQVKINLARLAARERSKIYFEFTPRRPGPLQLQVDFSCDKFSHVKGFVTIAVAPA